MNPTPPLPASRWRKFGIISAAVLLGAVLLLAITYWLVVPGVADSLVRDKLGAAEERLGVRFTIERVATHGVRAVSLEGFSVVDPTSQKPLFEATSISASVDAAALLFGSRELSGIVINKPVLFVHRYADGSTNIAQIIAQRKGTDAATRAPTDATGAARKDPSERVASFLAFFGGNWPDLTIEHAQLKLSADPEAEPWAVDAIQSERILLDSRGDSAELSARFDLTRDQARSRWSIPSAVTVQASLKLPLEESTGDLQFDSPLEVVDIAPFPFLRLGFTGASLTAHSTLTVKGLSLAIQGGASPTPLASVESISASFQHLQLPISSLRPLEIQIKKPALTIEYDAQSASGLNDLVQLVRAPGAAQVVARARGIANAIALDKGLPVEEDDAPRGRLARLFGDTDWSKLLAKKAPQSIVISDASIQVQDARPLALHQADPKLALKDGQLTLTHRVINGQLVLEGGFQARARADEPRGEAKVKLAWNYRNGAIDLDTSAEALSLPWLVQLTSARLAEKIRAGYVYADLKATRAANKKRLSFDGLVSLKDTTFFLAMLAEEPVRDLSASYRFDGFWDPNMALPEPELLKAGASASNTQDQPAVPDDDDEKADADKTTADAPPTRGALVVSNGQFEFNGVKGSFRPALYGLDGMSRRPNRLRLQVELPEAPVMALFQAVPDAIKGPLVGTRMSGSFAWSLDLEAPLYKAADMQWKSTPQLTNFELLDMPWAVDVRKLRDQFDTTIYDPTLEWSRRVTIPEMRPVPLEWLATQSGVDIERLRKQRIARGWPPEYAPGFRGDPDDPGATIRPHTAPWAAEDAAHSRATLTDSGDVDGLFGAAPPPQPRRRKTKRVGKIPSNVLVHLDGEEQEHPYGPYVYVPLQYISPWMLRAAITTEDNSFFSHHGFNWLAIRESVAANLNAGRYVRGASTISMQLVKNIFLTRDKVMVRKLREAFLVWLMEDVVDIPKSRILELYFNVIEYGPGIFGIQDAAVHYFGKRADKLTLSEVVWLVSIVPNPKKYHFYYERGAISDAWFNRMLRYVRVMVSRDRAREDEYEAARADKPEFYKPGDDEPMMRIERRPEDIPSLLDENAPIQFPNFRNLFAP